MADERRAVRPHAPAPQVRVVGTARMRREQRANAALSRYRYHRRHTPHYYLVLSGIGAAVGVCLLKYVAFENHSVPLATVAFAATAAATLLISSAFFWGFYMLMSGHIPAHRIKVLIPHAAVGVLSPLLYTINISVDLEGVGTQPISGLSLLCSVLCLGLLGVQFTMGKMVVRPQPLRVLRRADSIS